MKKQLNHMGCSLGWSGTAAVNSDVHYVHVYYDRETGRFRGKTISPKSAAEVKLIHAGKVLENNKTLADCRITLGDVPGGVITMHVVVQPPATKNKTDNNQEDSQKTNSCSCAIL